MIRQLSRQECLRVLARTRFARLACSRANQPYIVPVTLAYHEAIRDEACLYGVSARGQKLEWMRSNPLVCVEADEIASSDWWISVVVLGRYEELPEAPGREDERFPAQVRPRQTVGARVETLVGEDERVQAYRHLAAHSMWWEPGSDAWQSRGRNAAAEPSTPVYYKIWIDHVTGHESTSTTPAASSLVANSTPTRRPGALRGALIRLLGGQVA